MLKTVATLITIAVGLATTLGCAGGANHDEPGGAHAGPGNIQGHVMGFDLAATSHHFHLYADGGAIEVAVNDPASAEDLGEVRTHLAMLPDAFASGDFSMPRAVHAGTTVAGAAELARLREHVNYAYAETETGATVQMTTRNAEALAALHAFLRFQITDHATGDSMTIGERQ